MSTKEELDAHRVRAAKNESLFREVNERIHNLTVGNSLMFEERPTGLTIDGACECMDETCSERVTLTVAEYESVRADSNSFFVKSGHNVPDVDEVVREKAGYVVVRKKGAGARVAEKFDPRKRSS